MNRSGRGLLNSRKSHGFLAIMEQFKGKLIKNDRRGIYYVFRVESLSSFDGRKFVEFPGFLFFTHLQMEFILRQWCV